MSQKERLNQNGNNSEVDPEVRPRPRRRFSAAEKLRLLEEADRCREAGEVGALLRREGLYSSHLAAWREQRRQGQLSGLQGQKRGRKAEPQAAELAQLRRENEQLKAQLERAELIIEAQKKLCQLFNLPLSDRDGLK
jgi:transposase-like protein